MSAMDLDQLVSDRTATEEHVQSFLAKAYSVGLSEGATRLPETFYRIGNLATFYEALDWWPKDAPPACSAPSLSGMLMTYWQERNDDHTFISRLETMGARCVQWIVREGRDVASPNETAEERKLRLNRERVREHRAVVKAAEALEEGPADNAIAAADAELAALIAQRDSELPALEQAARDTHAASVAAGKARKECEAKWKAAIADAKARRKAAIAAGS